MRNFDHLIQYVLSGPDRYLRIDARRGPNRPPGTFVLWPMKSPPNYLIWSPKIGTVFDDIDLYTEPVKPICQNFMECLMPFLLRPFLEGYKYLSLALLSIFKFIRIYTPPKNRAIGYSRRFGRMLLYRLSYKSLSFLFMFISFSRADSNWRQ